MTNTFEISVNTIQPSQLYISRKKLDKVLEKFNPKKKETLGVIPIKELDDEIIFTDGHTRALAAYLANYESVTVEWETENLDWEMYRICVQWCKTHKIFRIADLSNRILSHDDYEVLWYKRCKTLQQELRNR